MTRRKKISDAVLFWTMAREWLQSYLPKVRRASPKTVEAYRTSLECLIGYLEIELGMKREGIGFGTLGLPTVRGWVAWMSDERSYSAKTVNLRLTALKSFLRYCSAEDASLTAAYVGACAIRPPKAAKRPVDYLKPEETRALLAACPGRNREGAAQQGDASASLRDRCEGVRTDGNQDVRLVARGAGQGDPVREGREMARRAPRRRMRRAHARVHGRVPS